MNATRLTVTALFLGATLSGAMASEVVDPLKISTDDYAQLDCYDLTEERGWITDALTGSGDMQGLELTDKDVARLKGYLIAIDTSMLRKKCGSN